MFPTLHAWIRSSFRCAVVLGIVDYVLVLGGRLGRYSFSVATFYDKNCAGSGVLGSSWWMKNDISTYTPRCLGKILSFLSHNFIYNISLFLSTKTLYLHVDSCCLLSVNYTPTGAFCYLLLLLEPKKLQNQVCKSQKAKMRKQQENYNYDYIITSNHRARVLVVSY